MLRMPIYAVYVKLSALDESDHGNYQKAVSVSDFLFSNIRGQGRQYFAFIIFLFLSTNSIKIPKPTMP